MSVQNPPLPPNYFNYAVPFRSPDWQGYPLTWDKLGAYIFAPLADYFIHLGNYVGGHLARIADRVSALEARPASTPAQAPLPVNLSAVTSRLDTLEAGNFGPALSALATRVGALESNRAAGQPDIPASFLDPTAPAGTVIKLTVSLGDSRADYTVTLSAATPGPFRPGQSLELRTVHTGSTVMHLGRTGSVLKSKSGIDASPPARPVGVLYYAVTQLAYSVTAQAITEGFFTLLP